MNVYVRFGVSRNGSSDEGKIDRYRLHCLLRKGSRILKKQLCGAHVEPTSLEFDLGSCVRRLVSTYELGDRERPRLVSKRQLQNFPSNSQYDGGSSTV